MKRLSALRVRSWGLPSLGGGLSCERVILRLTTCFSAGLSWKGSDLFTLVAVEPALPQHLVTQQACNHICSFMHSIDIH